MITTIDFEKLVSQITDEVVGILEKNNPFVYENDVQPDQMDMLIKLGASRLGVRPGISNFSQNLAPFIDHTLLKPEATPNQIEKLCEEASQYSFASVCIHPCYVKFAWNLLKSTRVKVCTVIGFPLGATLTPVKVYEAQLCEQDGAGEVDMVINIGALKSKGYSFLENDIASVVQGVSKNTLVKVIIETALLTDEEKIKACEISKRAGADFVKTSTGFASGGATAADIALMRQVVGFDMGVKASGGIRDKETAEIMIKAGASRLGTSASIKIVGGKASSDEKY